jgi:hypothetical protein
MQPLAGAAASTGALLCVATRGRGRGRGQGRGHARCPLALALVQPPPPNRYGCAARKHGCGLCTGHQAAPLAPAAAAVAAARRRRRLPLLAATLGAYLAAQLEALS